MHIRLMVASVRMATSTAVAEGESLSSGCVLYFSVFPAGDHHISLETGENFQHPYLGKGKTISATLEVHEVSEVGDREILGSMGYFAEVKSDDEFVQMASFIIFAISLPLEQLFQIVDNMRHAVFPKTILIGFEDNYWDTKSPLEFDWEPDGSGKKWNNLSPDSQMISVQSIDFDYELFPGASDDQTEGAAEPSRLHPVVVELRSMRAELPRALNSVATQVYIFVLIAALVFWAIPGIWHWLSSQ